MVATIALYYGKMPEFLTQKELDLYLSSKICPEGKLSVFKHLIHGLRYYYKSLDMRKKKFRLPSIKKPKTLPTVLNYDECRCLFLAPKQLRNRVLLSLMYSSGLRVSEVCALRIEDIDSGRMQIHIRQSKNSKDRYVPLSKHVLRGLKKYYIAERPQTFLFPGRYQGRPIVIGTVAEIVRQAAQAAGIRKHVTTHVLRHSYATHLLEMGMNILRVSKLLGHSDIDSTMVYLHVMNEAEVKNFSPFDRLYPDEAKN
jgi:site-specific recombinase XerD